MSAGPEETVVTRDQRPADPIEAGFSAGPVPPAQAETIAATLEAVAALAAKRKAEPDLPYTDPETGLTFRFRRLSGRDIDRINSWTQGDDDKYTQIMIEEASTSPKINLPFFEHLNDLSPLVRTGMTLFIREISGMGEDAIEKAKSASKQAATSS